MGGRAAPTRRRNYGRGHGYFLDGEKLEGRGVTTILSNGVPKNGLQYWAAKEVASCAVDERDIWEPLAERARDAAWEYLKEAPFRDRDAAARRGTEVHRLAEQLQEGHEVEVPEPLVGHVDSYLQFMEEWQPTDPICEGVVISRKHQYMGTFDLIATLDKWPGGPRRVLLDVKTSRSGIYPEVALQLAAYRFAQTFLAHPDGKCDEEPMPEVDCCAALHVRDDGYDLIPVRADLREFRVFQYVDQVARFLGTFKDPGWSSEVLGAPLTPAGQEVQA
jgi:hypothetical protein